MNERSIHDLPRTKQTCPEYKVKPRNSKQTLRELLTKDETEMQWITLLKQLSVRPKGPWKEYLQFYQANQSGDTSTFKPEGKKYVAKMIKDLEKEWQRQQVDVGDEAEEKK